ncbi:MAG: DHH family phosphoesterase [bacterium]|nr:DHH family phosphoesterase [bacterium]
MNSGNYDGFRKEAAKVADEFRNVEKSETIRLVSHLDADGISACSILIKALNRKNRKYSISIVQHLDEEFLEQLAREPYKYLVFTDIGSGQMPLIVEKLKDKRVFILDHHEMHDITAENVTQLNPHMFGINGSKEISGSGVVYFFAKALDERNSDMAHIAVIGSIGDVQENKGFKPLNNEILELAKKNGKIKQIKGLRVFGAQTKPLHKILEYSTEYYIPDVTGSESSAIQFLQQIGINPKDGKDWKKLIDLDDEELKKLVTGILMKRLNEKNPEDIIGPVYILCDEKKESPLKDAKEFATLLNACGRMNKASLGIGACLNDKKIKEKAVRQLGVYKKELVKALGWYGKKEGVSKGNGYILINAEDNVRPAIIGTVASIISKSGELSNGTFVLSMARNINSTKASLRISGRNNEADLVSIMSEITGRVDGNAGGHMNAAGAIIKTEREEDFIKAAKEILGKICLEEQVL